MKSTFVLTLCLVFCLCAPIFTVSKARAASEEELLQIIQRLEQRVDELEKRLGVTEEKQEAQGDKVMAVEQKVEAQATEAAEAPSSDDFRTYWKDGLRFEAGEVFKGRIGGRIHLDAYTGDVDREDEDFPDGMRFRRARIYLRGSLYEDIVYKAQYDFAGDGEADWKDVYVGYTGFDFADLLIGQFKEPFSLEELTSSNYMTFMERSPLNNLVPARNTGLMLANDELLDARFGWAAGVFLPSNDFGDADEEDDVPGDYAVTARITGVPWLEDDGERLVHLGLAYSYRDFNGDDLRFRSRGSFSRGPRLIDTGELATEDYHLVGGEAAFVVGPFSLQSEYAAADVTGDSGVDDSTYHGGYIEASYFLTGEHRPYSGGAFGRVRPHANFKAGEGWGAWQLATRLAYLDLTDSPIEEDAGELFDFVVGLNWYLNPNSRIMLNYVHSESEAEYSEAEDQDADIAQVRFQVDF